MSKKELIIEKVLKEKIKNLTTEKYTSLYSQLMLRSDITSIATLYSQVVKIISSSNITPKSPKYWIVRGWSEIESRIKSKEYTKTLPKSVSPFSSEFWEAKINPDTGQLYTKHEAEFKRNSLRPIRKEYWMCKGEDEQTAIELAKNMKLSNNIKGALSAKEQGPEIFRATSKRSKDYWMLKGHSSEEAAALVADYQTHFSLEKCIAKLGETDGIKRWEERQEQWLETLSNKSDEEKSRINRLKCGSGASTSKAEKYLYETLKKSYNTLGSQLSLYKDKKKVYIYDIYLGNKIIEYHGDFWHLNPSMYTETDSNPRTHRTAKETWERDVEKIAFATNNGYQVLVIWESEFKLNKQDIIDKCIQFLTQ